MNGYACEFCVYAKFSTFIDNPLRIVFRCLKKSEVSEPVEECDDFEEE